MKKIRSNKDRMIAFCLVLIISLTQFISTNALDDSECHVIKYTEDWLLQKMDEAKAENTFFNVDLVKLPFENDELTSKIIAEAEGMLLLDTVTEDDGCMAYVAMNPENYEIAIFTVNFADEKHNFKIEIEAEEVSDTKVDVYSEEIETAEQPVVEEKPVMEVPTDTVAVPEEKKPDETVPTQEPNVEPNTETKTSDNTGTETKPSDETKPEEVKPQEPEPQEPEQPQKPAEPVKPEPNVETEPKTEEKPSEPAIESKQEQEKVEQPTNIFESVDSMVKDSQNDSVVFTTKKVLNTIEETVSSVTTEQTEPQNNDESVVDKVEEPVTSDAKDESSTSTNPQEPSKTELPTDTALNEDTTNTNDNKDNTAIPTDPTDVKKEDEPNKVVSEKLVTQTLDIGNVGKAEMEIPSKGFAVFRTALVLTREDVSYLPVHLYDYDDSVSFKGSSIGSDHYVGENNGVFQGIAMDELKEKDTEGYYTFKSNNGINPFPQQFTSGDGVKMHSYNFCDFPFLIDSDGYYEYDSDKRGAKFNPLTNKVELLKTTGPDFGKKLDTKERTYGFFPFNKPGDEIPNYYFGMNLSVFFTMPKDGKVNNEDMTFEFSGDDDMWVYIDGKLALDLGGIHDDVAGSINFATGEIVHEKVYNASNGRNKTVVWNLYDKNNIVYGAQRNVGIEKEDYLQHTLQIFYMERGAGGSNCKMKFNLQPIPTNSVSVTKEVTGINPAIQNDDFEFTIKTKNSSHSYYQAKQLEYTVDNVKKVTDSNGRFTLKGGQTAYFENLTYFNIREKHYADYQQTWKIAGINKIYTNKNTGNLNASNGNMSLVFMNQYKYTDRTGDLQIEKILTHGVDSETEFDFHLLINDIPYTGNVDVYTGALKETRSISNGALKLKVNQRAVITEIPNNTTYEVFELGNEGYKLAYVFQNGLPHRLNEHVRGTISCYESGHGDDDEDDECDDDDDEDGHCHPKPPVQCILHPRVTFINERTVAPMGSITVKNIIRDNWQAHGDPIFVYKLEKLDGGRVVGTIYDYVRYEDSGTEQKQIVFNNLPLGYTYRVTQENTLRYLMATAKPDASNQGQYNYVYRSIDYNLSEQNRHVGGTFTNVKLNEMMFSHTDAAKNNITIKK